MIKKGDKFRCIKDVYMNGGKFDGSHVYKKDKVYISEGDRRITDENGEVDHYWHDYDDGRPDNDFLEHFVKLDGTEPKTEIEQVCDGLKDLLTYKNQKYGSSALEPINVLSKVDATTGLLLRADDKIARIKNSKELRKNDVVDLIGYLTLICVNNEWNNFDEFKD
jgi:hypothetical protein